MLDPSPTPPPTRAPRLWVCTRDGAFVLLGERFHLLAGTEGRPLVAVGYHPRGRWFLATPTQLMELVGNQAHRVRNARPTCMAVDRVGEVWLGTDEGLVRHLGKEFRHYHAGRHFPDNRIRGLAEDGDGHLYVGTAKGLAVFDRPRWLTISWDWVVTSLDRSLTGRVWVGHQTGAASFAGMHRVVRLEGGELATPPRAIMDAPDGGAWFALGEWGLWRRSPEGELRRVPLQGEGRDVPAPAAVTRLHVDLDGTVWAGIPGVGVARVDPSGGVTMMGLAEGLLSHAIEALGRWPMPH